MAFQWMRRALLALAPAALLALAACGSGTIESQFKPSRMVVFGDGLSDMGQTGTRYTVNDATAVWVKLVALDYGAELSTAASGGTDYATGNARVSAKPDAAGNAATRTIKEQIDAFTATNTLGSNDLVIMQGGISDIIAQFQAYRAGTQTSAQMLANVKQAGVDFAEQAKRISAAGASHVGVLGAYDLSKTPWGISTGELPLLSSATTAFNAAVLVGLVNEGSKMLYIDTALLFNLMSGNPGGYSLVDSTHPVCVSVDPGPGIGIGNNQVSSALCTSSTIAANVNYATSLWADPIYPTPSAHSRLADYAFGRLRERW